MDKLANNLQNFAQVRLQLKFAFRIWLLTNYIMQIATSKSGTERMQAYYTRVIS